MNPEAERFLQEKIQSPLRLEVTLYFHHNPFTMDYADGAAMRLGLHPALVSQALEKLAEAGILHKRVSQFAPSRPTVYSYTRDPSIRAAVDTVARLMEDADARPHLLALLDAGEEIDS